MRERERDGMEEIFLAFFMFVVCDTTFQRAWRCRETKGGRQRLVEWSGVRCLPARQLLDTPEIAKKMK